MIQSKDIPRLSQPQRRQCWLYNQGTGIPAALLAAIAFKSRVNSLDDVLMLEHPPVYTSDRQRLKFSNLTLTNKLGRLPVGEAARRTIALAL